MNQKKLPKILITMGDAAGIGPEISVKAALDAKIRRKCLPIIIGDINQLHEIVTQMINDTSFSSCHPELVSGSNSLSFELPRKKMLKQVQHDMVFFDLCKNTNKNYKLRINVLDEKLGGSDALYDGNIVNVIDVKFKPEYKVKAGLPDKVTGKYSFLYLEKALDLIKNSFAEKLVTAPISKKAWQDAGILYPAHTEALAGMTNTKKYSMIFANRKVKVVLATRHIPVKDISENFDKKSLEDALDIGIQFLDMIGVEKKRIGVCGLNPHAGEDGCNGDEEIKIISPVLNQARYKNIKFYGPVSGDAVFHKAMTGELDLVVAAYHDQGIFPLKAMDYFGCVNITIGLPFIRVSPGHGTAFDIAGKNLANPDAMIEAILWSLKLKI